MTDNASTQVPDHYAEIIAAVRVYAANAPDSLREHLYNALDDYETSGAWQSDDPSLYV